MVRFFTLTYSKTNVLARRDPPDGLLWSCHGALALARCTFHLKMMLPPQRGAHVHHLAGHEHHLGPSKLSSRCCVVRFFEKRALADAWCAFLHSPMKNQCFWRAGTPRTGFFGRAAVLRLLRGALFDPKRCSRLSAVLICIFGRSGAPSWVGNIYSGLIFYIPGSILHLFVCILFSR